MLRVGFDSRRNLKSIDPLFMNKAFRDELNQRYTFIELMLMGRSSVVQSSALRDYMTVLLKDGRTFYCLENGRIVLKIGDGYLVELFCPSESAGKIAWTIRAIVLSRSSTNLATVDLELTNFSDILPKLSKIEACVEDIKKGIDALARIK